MAGMPFTSMANADDWGCEVALCITNPAGPMAVSECVSPIERLYRHLARGGSFPLCKSVDGHVRFTRYGKDHYEDCPSAAKTIYRREDYYGRGPLRLCETFSPIEGGYHGEPDRADDSVRYEVRTVNGRRVYGKVELKEPHRRSRPSYLEYVVQGETKRIWW